MWVVKREKYNVIGVMFGMGVVSPSSGLLVHTRNLSEQQATRCL